MKVPNLFLSNLVVLSAINWLMMLEYAQKSALSLCAMIVKMDGKDRTTVNSNAHNANNKLSPENLTRLKNLWETAFY